MIERTAFAVDPFRVPLALNRFVARHHSAYNGLTIIGARRPLWCRKL
jgi:hypothetical protein